MGSARVVFRIIRRLAHTGLDAITANFSGPTIITCHRDLAALGPIRRFGCLNIHGRDPVEMKWPADTECGVQEFGIGSEPAEITGDR